MTVLRRILVSLALTLSMNSLICALYFNFRPTQKVLLFSASLLLILLVNVYPLRVKNKAIRLRALKRGHELIILFSATFLLSTAANIAFGIALVPHPVPWWLLAVNIVICLLVELVLLLNGLSRVFLVSLQLGIKWRILMFCFWWMPVVNVRRRRRVCRLLRNEYEVETAKNELNAARKEREICRTRYPLLLVHGVFFRDSRYFNYWGWIPGELRKNGTELYFGEQQSAASVADSAAELAERIKQIVTEAGCEKVNIIAHSKGGLDARYAVSKLGVAPYVASLTTVCTPHHGCIFADKLLEKAPESLKRNIARKYNAALRRLGDKKPDFLAAVSDLTASSCEKFNAEVPDNENVYYQSVAAIMNSWTSGKFPMNLSNLLVRPFDGENDGLVSVGSARWGDNCKIVTVEGTRGISHGDMIDLNRENIDGFDVRELYVEIVSGLKAIGL